MKLKKISIILIIFIAFMSIATANAMDDSSSVSLDDSSNYNASDLDLNSADAGSNLLSNQDSISSADYEDSASTSLGELEGSDLDSESGVISSHNEESGNSNSEGSDSNILYSSGSDVLYSSGSDVLSSSSSDVLSSSGSNVLSASEFVIYEKDYNTYFGSDGMAKASINKAGNIIKLAGSFKNKTFIFTVPLTVTSYNSNTRLYDCIVSFAGGSGTSSNYAKVYGLNIYSNASNAFQRPCIYINEFDYVSVYDNTVFNTGQSSYGIYVYYSNHCNVTRNKVQTRVGIGGCWQHAGICLTGSHYNYIANNDVKVEDSNAIYLSKYNGAVSNNNVIFNNTVRCTLSSETPSVTELTQPSAWCYLIHTMGDNNTIMNNTILNGFVGVYAEGANNRITGNYISGLHGAYMEGTEGNEGGEAAIYSKTYSYVANNTIVNCSIHTERLAGGIQVDKHSQVIDNYVQIANDGYAMYITSNCTIRNNTLISLGGGIDVARLDNYNNTIAGNNISCNNGYNIKITASGNLIENNTLVNTNNADGTKLSAVYLCARQSMDSNRIIGNTIYTNTSYVVYLQGNASNTLIQYNTITSNNSNPFIEKIYGNGASNAQKPENTTILNNNLDLPITEVNITDETYDDYFENGYLIRDMLPDDPNLQTVLIIYNLSNKNMTFDQKISIDGRNLGNITNCTLNFVQGSSGSKVENLIMNYSCVENSVNLIAIGRDVSDLTISNNNFFVCESESLFVKVIDMTKGGNSNIIIANNQISIEANESEAYGIDLSSSNGQMDNIYILNNEIDIAGLNTVYGIRLNGLTNSKIESNLISSKSTGELLSSNAYGISGFNLNGVEILRNSLDIDSECLSCGLSLYNPQNINIHNNNIFAIGSGALGIDLTGSSESINKIYENTVKISGGDCSGISAQTTIGNYLVSITDDVGAGVYNNTFIVLNKTPLNVQDSKLNGNSFLINDETIHVLFDSADDVKTISSDSNIKSGDVLVFDSLNNEGLIRFEFDIPLTLNSSSDELVLRNIEFVLNDGARGSTIDHLRLNNTLGECAIVLNQTSNVLIDGIIIEANAGDYTGLSIIDSDNVSMIYSTVNLTSSNMAYPIKSSNSSNLDISFNRLESQSKAAFAFIGTDVTDSIFKSNIMRIYGSGNDLETGLNVPQAGIYLNGTSSDISIADNEIKSSYEPGGDYAIVLDLNGQSTNISLLGNDLASNNSQSLGIWAIRLGDDVDEISNKISISSTSPVDKTVTVFEFANMGTISNVVLSDGTKALGGVFKFRLATVDGDALANRNVSLRFKGVDYDLITDADGYANVTLAYDYGYNGPIGLGYYGEYSYYAANINAYVNAPKLQTKIVASNMNTLTLVNAAYNTGDYYKFYLRDANNKALGGKTVKVILDGRTYNVKTDSNGMAKLQVNLKTAKTYDIKFYFAGDSYYSASSASAKIKAVKNSVVIKAPTVKVKRSKAGKFYVKVTLKSKSGKALIKKTVKLTVNGKTYKVKTSNKGVAKFKVKLPKKSKTYKYKVKFAGDKQNYAKTKSGKIKVL